MNNSPGEVSSVGPISSNIDGGQRILPIMSAPQHRNQQKQCRQHLQMVGQQQSHVHMTASGSIAQSHRRKPPEKPNCLVQSSGEIQDSMQPPAQRYQRRSGSGKSGGDGEDSSNSNIDFDPMSNPDLMVAPFGNLGAKSRVPRFDSSGGSGNSSCGEGKMLELNSSGSSDQSRLTRKSTAQDWFNTFNSDVRGNQSFPNYDNDSPYYMPRKKHQAAVFRHTRPLKPNPPGHQPPTTIGGAPQVGILESTEESNSESFRSVIDDLTIKNQKLKRRLRKLEGFRGRDQGERLFEVRIHDLPEGKKNELERLLQKFSASLDNDQTSSGSSSRNNVTPVDQSIGPGGGDSGYNTMPRAGDSPLAVSSSHGSKLNEQLRPWPNAQTNVELSKMKTIVTKLEHLFTGGDATISDRSQLLQQQNISNLAAGEDRQARLADGVQTDSEGAREASLMSPVPYNAQTNYQNAGDTKQTSGDSSPVEVEEQRPTRPLDLDPSRRQVAEDNIEYLTHMTESSTKGFGVGGGWVYLNLIINLAQLHTINVTPPFVKKAISTVSTKIELSLDGKMVRWKGGSEGTIFSSNRDSGCGSGENCSEQSPGNTLDNGSKATRKRSSETESLDSVNIHEKSQSSPKSADSKFHYKPIFAQSQSFDDESSSAPTSSDSDSNDILKRNGSEDYANGVVRRLTGPIIYYKGGNFCTDLSATVPGQGNQALEGHIYERFTNRPLGAKCNPPESPSTKRESPLYQEKLSNMLKADNQSINEEEMDLDNLDTSIEFSPEFTAVSPGSPRPPIEFEVSGIGGVLPADNFAINCQTRHYLLPDNHGRLPMSRTRTFKFRMQRKIHHRIPQASIDAFHEQENSTEYSVASSASSNSEPQTPDARQVSRHRPLRHEILSANTLKLPPSKLPPASFIFTSASEESSSYCESEDDAPNSSLSDDYFFNLAALPSHAYRTSSGEENESGLSGFERSPSSAATAGDGSRACSVFSTGSPEQRTFDAPISVDDEDQSSSADSGSGNGFTMFPPGRYSVESPVDRPHLKRSRGSVYSSGSMIQIRKSARTGTGENS